MKGRLLTSLLAMVVLSGLQAQETPVVPRLVVGITIDQLRRPWLPSIRVRLPTIMAL